MLNKTELQGRLCADPELRRTNNDIPVTSFRIAWSEKYKETETKLFLNCTAWRGTGEFVNKYFRKGQEIVVSGKLISRDWEDNEGNKRTSLELIVDEAHFCGAKRDESAPRATAGPAPTASARDVPDLNEGFNEEVGDDDQLPF